MTTVSMSVQDALWLTMDRPNNLMVVDGSMVLRGVPSIDDVTAVLQEAVERFPVLGRRAVRSGMGWASSSCVTWGWGFTSTTSGPAILR